MEHIVIPIIAVILAVASYSLYRVIQASKDPRKKTDMRVWGIVGGVAGILLVIVIIAILIPKQYTPKNSSFQNDRIATPKYLKTTTPNILPVEESFYLPYGQSPISIQPEISEFIPQGDEFETISLMDTPSIVKSSPVRSQKYPLFESAQTYIVDPLQRLLS